MYKTLKVQQIYKLFSNKKEIIKSIISSLIKKQRLYYDRETNLISINPEYIKKCDNNIIKAFWILLDFIDKAEYHSISEYPSIISFFANNEIFNIIYVAFGNEKLINYTFNTISEKNFGKIIVIVDEPEQIEKININNIAGFCSVSLNGKISYYQYK